MDLLKMDTHDKTCNFFETMSAFSYKPSILQPTRVSSTSATLIDNIFTNDLDTSTIGGNLTTSLSDHFP